MTPTPFIQILKVIQGLAFLIGGAMLMLMGILLPVILYVAAVSNLSVDWDFIVRYLAFSSALLLIGALISYFRRTHGTIPTK